MISGFTQTSFLNFYHVLSWLWSFSIITYNNKFVTGVMIKAQTFNDSDDDQWHFKVIWTCPLPPLQQSFFQMDPPPSMRSRWLDIGQVLFLCLNSQDSRGLRNSQKRTRPISSHLDQKSLVKKDLLFGLRENFSHRTRQAVLSRQDSSILPAQVANHSVRLGSSCPLMELAT